MKILLDVDPWLGELLATKARGQGITRSQLMRELLVKGLDLDEIENAKSQNPAPERRGPGRPLGPKKIKSKVYKNDFDLPPGKSPKEFTIRQELPNGKYIYLRWGEEYEYKDGVDCPRQSFT